MGIETALLIGAGVGALTGGVNAYQAKRAGDKQASSAKKQLEQAKETAAQEDQARNKANQKTVDVESLLQDNAFEGLGSTTLTGNLGDPINPSSVIGGGNKLLGD